MFLRRSLLLFSALVFALGSVTSAQQTQDQTPTEDQQSRRGRLERRHGRRAFMLRERRLRLLGRELGLTETQREQLKAVRQRQLASTKSQREELFGLLEKRRAGTLTDEDLTRAKELRQQMQESRKNARDEFQSVLTAEQRERIEELKQQLRTRRLERMQRRQELRRQ